MAEDRSYWAEISANWRILLGATLGLGFGLGLNAYTMSLFGPRLIAEFGWTKSEFALVGTFSLLMLIAQPIAGRLADRHGVRAVAAVGVIGLPLTFLIYATIAGDIRHFYLAMLVQMVVGTFTTTPIYSRLVAERIVRARGLAFAIVMSGPPLAGFVVAPTLDVYITAFGWRHGYLLLGGLSLVFGSLALLLMPARHPSSIQQASRPRAQRRGDYVTISRSAMFWLIFAGMILINLPQTLLTSQFKLMLVDGGAGAETAARFISLLAVGVLIGRFACGLALDRLPTHLVAAVCLALPAIGFLLLASPFDSTPMLLAGVIMLGFAQGSEGDIVAYLVARHFGLDVFSLVMSLMIGSTVLGSSIGAVLLSISLGWFDNYVPFMFLASGVTMAGALLFLLLGLLPSAGRPAAHPG